MKRRGNNNIAQCVWLCRKHTLFQKLHGNGTTALNFGWNRWNTGNIYVRIRHYHIIFCFCLLYFCIFLLFFLVLHPSCLKNISPLRNGPNGYRGCSFYLSDILGKKEEFTQQKEEVRCTYLINPSARAIIYPYDHRSTVLSRRRPSHANSNDRLY